MLLLQTILALAYERLWWRQHCTALIDTAGWSHDLLEENRELRTRIRSLEKEPSA